MNKKLVAIVAGLAIAFAGTSSFGADFVDEQQGRVQPPDLTPGWTGAHVDDLNSMIHPSFIKANKEPEISQDMATLCHSLKDAACQTPGNIMRYNAYLPSCENKYGNSETDCIESVSAIDSSGKEILGVFKTYMPETKAPVTVGDPALGMASGWNPSLWNFPGITHQGGSDFLVSASILSYHAPVGNPTENAQLFTSIFPVSEVASTQSHEAAHNVANSDGKMLISQYRINNDQCPLWLGENQCAVAWPFPSGVRFKINVRTSGPISGWLHGRLSSPDVKTSSNGNGLKFSIEGAPSLVPIFSTWKRFETLKPEFQTLLKALDGPQKGIVYNDGSRTIFDRASKAPYEKLVLEHDLDRGDQSNFDEFAGWLAESDNKALATKSAWSFYSNQVQYGNAGGGRNVATCSDQTAGLAGLVATNATLYLSTPPVFNEKTGSLDYQVSSPHFDRNGKANIGTYDLIIKSAVARCLYGYTSAPVQASVSIISADGTSQLATSVLNEKDGWLHLYVAGFGYSAPTLRIKLSQPKLETKPVTTKAVKKITCVKGKVSRVVTSATCPSGYKKK